LIGPAVPLTEQQRVRQFAPTVMRA
jgi:hypothetical protein